MLRLRWGLAATGPHLLALVLACAAIRAAGPVREISWADIAPPLRQLLARHGIHQENLTKRLVDIRERNRARVGEGDRDHLIYYVLQSTAFTKLPPIEPALSAREFVATGTIPVNAKARIDAFMSGASARSRTKQANVRLSIFREMLAREPVDLAKEYARAMAFAAPVGEQYQARGLSTDTSIDANYTVFLSLAALRRLEPDRRIRSVLIVGPGMDLAPRTGFVESQEPQSYQPFAVMDALLATGLSQRDTLRVTGADINPRVVEWLTRARGTRPALTLAAAIQETSRVKLSEDYREYFSGLGKAIGSEQPLRDGSKRMGKSLTLAPGVTDAIDAVTADIIAERVDTRYDLIVVTNVFPYLSDSELLLAMSNIARMLNPGGILIHNEPRPVLAEALASLEMALLQSRSGVVATVDGNAPLYDSVWMHSSR